MKSFLLATSKAETGEATHRLFRLLGVLWVGSLLTIGYVAAPVLFSTLERASAGMVAARLFQIEAVFGLVCGTGLLLWSHFLVRRGVTVYRHTRILLVAMLICVLFGYFALQPFMNAWRLTALQAGIDVSHSGNATRFALMHGVASVFYLIESVLGLVLIWRLPAGVDGSQLG